MIYNISKEVRLLKTRKPAMLRFPPKLYERLIREAGERTMRTGKRVSVNEVVMQVVERFFLEKDQQREKRRN